MPLDDQMLRAMPLHTIFADGRCPDTSIGMGSTGKQLHWIAVRGGGPADWAIYCSPDYWTEERIRGLGDKIHDEKTIRRLVPCDDQAYESYRQ